MDEDPLHVRRYLAVPYRLLAYSEVGADGEWHRYAEYPEIGCRSQGETPEEAMAELEELRVAHLVERLSRGEAVPLPRLHLRSSARSFSPWFVAEVYRRIAEARARR